MTTIVSVRRGNQVALAGDGQVSLGNTVMKGNASKVRRLYRGKVLAGFAGGTADAFTLFERFEAQLEKYQGHLTKAAVELAKDWRTGDQLLSTHASDTDHRKPTIVELLVLHRAEACLVLGLQAERVETEVARQVALTQRTHCHLGLDPPGPRTEDL